MKKSRRILAVLAALSLTVSLTACGGSGDTASNSGGETTASAAETVAAAIEKLNGAKSVSMQMQQDINMSIAYDGQSQDMNMVTTMNMDLIQEPAKMKGTMTIDVGEELGGSQNVELYMMKEDDATNLYMNAAGQWTKQAVDTASMDQYDIKNTLDIYLDSASEFKEEGTEQVGGADATKYTGTIKGDNITKVMEESGMLDSMGQVGLSSEQITGDELKELMSGLGDMSMTVWVNADGYPVQYSMDMNQMLSGIMDKAMELAGAADQGVEISVSKAQVTISCSNFDGVQDFELPAEAQNAVGA
nr:DUF6612 family protein [uncultured Butyricicoccus sp.]